MLGWYILHFSVKRKVHEKYLTNFDDNIYKIFKQEIGEICNFSFIDIGLS